MAWLENRIKGNPTKKLHSFSHSGSEGEVTMTFLGRGHSPCCSCCWDGAVSVASFTMWSTYLDLVEDTVDLELNVMSSLMCGLCHD
jgi:hypothetical protein